MAQFRPPYQVIDDFLDAETADALLEQIIAAGDGFTASEVRLSDGSGAVTSERSSRRLPGRVGVDLKPLIAAVHTRFDALCGAAGMQPFAIHHTECSVVAHGDGDYYRRHIDTRTGSGPLEAGHVRVLSCVYYLHRRPAGFSGGELALHEFRGDIAARIAPRHNRLAVFPSFVPHEVLPVISPDGGFADQRFSINCWLRKAIG